MKRSAITIIGGGIAGLTMAISLQKIGVRPTIFEASDSLEPVGAGLGLGINAMMGFRALGIYEEVASEGSRIREFTIYDQSGKPITKTPFTNTHTIDNFAIHRADLHKVLLSQIDSETIHLGKRVAEVKNRAERVEIQFEDGSHHSCDFLIVADGIHSVVRQSLLPKSRARYAGYTCWRAVIDFQNMDSIECSEIWGTKGRFGMVPLKKNQVYWFACVNAPAHDPVFAQFKISDLEGHFNNYPLPIPNILQQTSNERLIHNDISDLAPLKQFAFGRIVLIGDAAHATTPNMGQGACQAIEDAIVLAKCMAKERQTELAFKAFENLRSKRTKWVTDTSRQIGSMAQLSNPLLIKARNTLLRNLPDSFNQKQLKKLEDIAFSAAEFA